MTEQPPSAASLWTDLVEKDDRISPEEYPDMALITFDEFEYLLNHFAERVCEQRVSAALAEHDKAALEVVRAAKAHEDAAVSAETERCALVAENEAKDYAALYVLEGFPEDLKRRDAAERVARRIRIRAPAERPAPPQPLQRSGPKGVNPRPRCTATWGQEYCKVRDCPANQQQDSPRRIGVEQPTQQAGEPGCGMAETARSRAASIVGTWQDLHAHVHLYTDAALDDLELRIAHALSPAPSSLASTGEQSAPEEEPRCEGGVPLGTMGATCPKCGATDNDLCGYLFSAEPPTDAGGLSSASNTDPSQATTAAPSRHLTPGEQSVMKRALVRSTKPVSPPAAVVDYTERAQKWKDSLPNGLIPQFVWEACKQHFAAALSAVASEHQAEIAELESGYQNCAELTLTYHGEVERANERIAQLEEKQDDIVEWYETQREADDERIARLDRVVEAARRICEPDPEDDDVITLRDALDALAVPAGAGDSHSHASGEGRL